MNKESVSFRRKARVLALQALYQWLLGGHDISEIELQFRVANNMNKVDDAYFCHLLYGVTKEVELIEGRLIPFLDRALTDLNPVELSVLRLSGYELLFCPEIPYRVILNEAVTLAKTFGSQDGHRYVNGVLNNLARVVRSVEVGLDNG